MMPAANLIAFALAAWGLILIPGPSMLFVIGRSLALGRIGGLLSVVGNAAGCLVIAAAVALGLGVIIEESVVVFTIVKIAGALYLVYLGIQTIRHRNEAGAADGAAIAPRSKLRVLGEGFLVGLTNPKIIVFFIAVLPQFVDRSAGSVPLQLGVFGAIFVVIALLSDSVWALVAGSARDWFARSPRRIARLRGAGGFMMIGLGVAVLFVGHGGGSKA
jgi:threonine/homoserine/homoserine lactone efflux protein